jgi:hypothetical protein
MFTGLNRFVSKQFNAKQLTLRSFFPYGSAETSGPASNVEDAACAGRDA